MNRSKLAMKNSIVGLLSQVVTIVLQFVTRSIFIRYLGVELLGISSTFSSVLNTLSLAELGFQTAIVYLLYKPLAENDTEQVNSVLGVLRGIYWAMGGFLCLAGAACIPFLPRILKGVEVTGFIRLIFMLQVAQSAITYLLADRRTLMYADQRSYLIKLINVSVCIVFATAKIIAVILTQSYLVYLLLSLAQNVTENTIIHLLDRRYHPYIHRTAFSWPIFREAWAKVKDLFVAKIAGYVYNATDSLVVSTLVGTIQVGYMVNYTTITTAVKTVCQSILTPIAPLIGNYLAANKTQEATERIFRLYTYIWYWVAGLAVLPLMTLLQSFISAWIGEQYILPDILVYLYGADLYIHFVHTSLVDFVHGQGLFAEEKRIEIIGAASNLVLSVLLAPLLGIPSVLIGTVISQTLFWIGRSIIVYRSCFSELRNGLRSYWLEMLWYLLHFCILAALMQLGYRYITFSFFPLRFLCGGIFCEILFTGYTFLVFGRTENHRRMMAMLKQGKKKGTR